VVLARRDSGDKQSLALASVVATATALLERMHDEIYANASARLSANTHEVSTVADAIEVAQGGFAKIAWSILKVDGGEKTLRDQAITVRCLQRADGSLPADESEADLIAFVAKSY
jgi:prolyl-tRNA synthetase